MIQQVRHFIALTGSWLKHVITQPREELDRWQRAARFAYDLFRFGGRQLNNDRASQMAAALAYHTLFATVPVLIVGTLLVKGLRGTETFLQMTEKYWASLGLDQIRLAQSEEGRDTSLADWLQDLVLEASEVNLAAIGWVGVAIIAYAAIGLMGTIESGFNTIYRAPTGRPWTRRVPLYWFALTVYPVAIALTWYANEQVDEWVGRVPDWGVLLTIANILWGLIVMWMFLMAFYTQLPNTVVRLKYAAIGALVAAVLVQIGRHSLDAYLNNAFSLNQLYSSLGLVPLFMFWVYLMWLAVLFGLEVSAVLQGLRGRHLEEVEQSKHQAEEGFFEPAAVLSAMEIVAERFAAGEPCTPQLIAEECGLTEATVVQMLEELVEHRVLLWVDAEDATVSLARPPETIAADELLQIGFHLADEASLGRRSGIVEHLRQAQRELASGFNLAGLPKAKV